ncbi:hypothetical protein R1sor_023390 [Riccia sorocarpa]|uniref:Uncharacterized protein n=1 Tax=Riccia sorocarpa TaxID=122646 RepID=A0ABD3GTI0_9MARC
MGFAPGELAIHWIQSDESFSDTEWGDVILEVSLKARLPIHFGSRRRFRLSASMPDLLATLKLVNVSTWQNVPVPNLNFASTSGGGIRLQHYNLQPLPESSPEDTSGRSSRKPVFKWDVWKVVVLAQVQREESLAPKGKDSRERLGGQTLSGLNLRRSQIHDFMDKSGNGNFFEMDREERKENKLPWKFDKESFDLMKCLGRSPSINPACMAESFDRLSSDDEAVGDDEDEEDEEAAEDEDTAGWDEEVPTDRENPWEATSKAISGIRKRKKAKLSSTETDTESLSVMSEEVVSVEKEKLKFLREWEVVRLDIAKERLTIAKEHAVVMREHSRNLCAAFGMIAQSLDKIAVALQK